MERPLWKHALYVLFEEVCLFLFGGISYCLIEISWRGYTHWTMGIVGGLCFLGIGLLNNLVGWDMPLRVQMFLEFYHCNCHRIYCRSNFEYLAWIKYLGLFKSSL